MNVDVEANGRRRAVTIERRHNEWIVTIDGRAVAATVTEVGGRWSLLIGPPRGAPPAAPAGRTAAAPGAAEARLHGGRGGEYVESGFSPTDADAVRAWRSYEVSFSEQDGEGTIVFVDGVPMLVAVADPRARFRRRNRDSGTAAGATRAIVAPMPGRVVKVLVEHGQTVAARQPVVVVEAMKMENELRAPGAGTVTAVHVTEGMSVDAHAVLVVLE